MFRSLCVGEGRFLGMLNVKVGLHSCMNDCLIFVCGSVSHDDKDCSLWLHSKGILKSNEQQFGPWIRAPLFNSAKKSFVEVKGFDTMNRGVDGLMTLHGTHVVHSTTKPYFSLNNINTLSTS